MPDVDLGTWTDRNPGQELPLALRPVGVWEAYRADNSPGRRLRTFAGLVRGFAGGREVQALNLPRVQFARPVRYQWLLNAVERSKRFEQIRAQFSALPIRCTHGWYPYDRAVETLGESYENWNPDLHQALQDLGYQVASDLALACEAFDNPDLFYPGSDKVAPVSDEHVRLVIWGVQRELKRETRPSLRVPGLQLPAAPLDQLPWHVQRAFVERRRYRFLQWGIDDKAWAVNKWSLWNVPEDDDWQPPWGVDSPLARQRLRV